MLGTLPSVLSIHRLSVTPVVGIVPAACIPALRASPAEVAAIFSAPLRLFLGARGHTHKDVPWVHGPAPGIRFRLHYFEYGELGPIWRAPFPPTTPLSTSPEMHVPCAMPRRLFLSARGHTHKDGPWVASAPGMYSSLHESPCPSAPKCDASGAPS